MIPLATLAQCKNAYLEYRTLRYQIEHPDATESKARKYARVAWRKKIKKWEAQGKI